MIIGVPIYAAIRKNEEDGCEFYFTDEMGYSADDAEVLARNHDFPTLRPNGYAAANPVVRIAKFEVKEIPNE